MRRMRKSAAALLLSGRIGESFDAIVTGAADKGTRVRFSVRPSKAGWSVGSKASTWVTAFEPS